MVCCILVTYALFVFPIPGTDSAVFIPSAVQYAKGIGFVNPLYYIAKFTDPTHTYKYNYYVPLYSYVLGMLGKIKPDVRTIFFFCALVSSINLILFTRVVSSFLPEKKSGVLKATILLSITYIATYLFPTVGRPENFTCLFTFLVYLLYLNRNEVNKTLYTSLIILLLGSMLATQIICFYFCFLFYALYELLNAENIYKNILKNFIVFAASLALFCVILQISPNGLVSTINGIRLHIEQVIFSRTDRSVSLFFHYWLLAPTNVGFIAVFVLGTGFFLKEMQTRLKGAKTDRIIFSVLIIIMIAYGIGKFILYASPTVYNATQFILPLAAYIFYNIFKMSKSSLQSGVTTIALVTFIAGSFIFLRSFLLFINTQQSGKDYASAKAAINKFTATNRRVYITTGLWSLFDDLNRPMPAGQVLDDEDMYKSGDTIIFQDANRGAPSWARDSAVVIYNWGSAGKVRFLGIPLSNRTFGYSFVAYKVK